MAETNTTKDGGEKIRSFISEHSRTRAIYSVWNPSDMKYRVLKKGFTRYSAQDVDSYNMSVGFNTPDMWVARAIEAFKYSPPEYVACLVNYWHDEDYIQAVEEQRPPRNIPYFFNSYFCNQRIVELVHGGVVARYSFFPLVKREGFEHKTLTIYRLTQNGATVYKTRLEDNLIPHDLQVAYYTPDDAFACCLNAQLIATFLSSPYIKNVRFGYAKKVGPMKRKTNCTMCMNPGGRVGDERKDIELIFEGITFYTDTSVVTEADRYKRIVERVKELSEYLKERKHEKETYLLVNLEDAISTKKFLAIVGEVCPDLAKNILVTTGNVLEAADSVNRPENVRDCFARLTEGCRAMPAQGLFFLEWTKKSAPDNRQKNFSLNFKDILKSEDPDAELHDDYFPGARKPLENGEE